jgi:hypothetical protein
MLIAKRPGISVPLRLPFFGIEGKAIDSALPELQAYLKERYPQVRAVRIVYRNPHPVFVFGLMATALHDAVVVISVFNPFTKRLAEHLGDDVYKWMKRRFKRVLKGHKPASTCAKRKG